MTKASKSALKMMPVEFAEDALDGFERGGRVVGLTKGQFSLIHLIAALLKKTGAADVVISTWSAGLYDGQELRRMMDSGLVLSVLIVTDRSYVTRQKNYAVKMEEAFGAANIRTTNTHSKFVLISNEDWKICIRSSMNLNENRRCENFDLDDDPAIFDFYRAFCDEIFEAMPEGFVESRATVDPVFEALMGRKPVKVEKKKFVLRDKFGREIR